MNIQGKRITLRPIAMSDLPCCTRWAADMEIMKHVGGRTFTPKEEREWLEGVLRNPKEHIFAILKEDGSHIGMCGLHMESTNSAIRNEPGLSIGMLIGEKSEWGKGYAGEVMTLLAHHAHEAYGAKRVWLTVDVNHERAIRAYEKAGFRIHRKFQDTDRKVADGFQYVMEKNFET
jgi:RimJ/RimL family protein N-acetyltransferase